MHRLDQLLIDSTTRYPDHIAAEDPDRGTEITYRDLDAITSALREELRGLGVKAGDRVGIAGPKSIGTVAALFSALKADAAYVPVDPTAPFARSSYIFKDCSVRALFVDRSLFDGFQAEFDGALTVVQEITALQPYGADLLLVKTPDMPDAQPPPEGLSYILYTSGSTGKPKGVMHTHATALAFVDWCSMIYHPTPEDRFSSHAPFHFDLSILDLYVPIKHGARIVVIGEELGKTPLRLANAIAERRITAWYSTPSILRLLVEFGKLEEKDYTALRIVNFAGEVFPIKHFRALKALWPHPHYYNLYGPTETNVCTYYDVPDDIGDRTTPFPIGWKCSDDECLVMDMDERPVAPGEEGELYVAGGSVMKGYWNLPERNALAFFVDADGTPWYKTGDVVREEGDGLYLFIGRRDRMVKRRGYRVELGEIESALYKHPSITEAAVVAMPDAEGGVVIKAFYASDTGETLGLIALKQYCAKALPSYMSPDRFHHLAVLPKTSTDKVDYQRLKEMG
jgi:amino acid adenylation domain-containing protein